MSLLMATPRPRLEQIARAWEISTQPGQIASSLYRGMTEESNLARMHGALPVEERTVLHRLLTHDGEAEIGDLLAGLPMDTEPAYNALERLVACGLVAVVGRRTTLAATVPRRDDDPAALSQRVAIPRDLRRPLAALDRARRGAESVPLPDALDRRRD